jgi:hypothetical protein
MKVWCHLPQNGTRRLQFILGCGSAGEIYRKVLLEKWVQFRKELSFPLRTALPSADITAGPQEQLSYLSAHIYVSAQTTGVSGKGLSQLPDKRRRPFPIVIFLHLPALAGLLPKERDFLRARARLQMSVFVVGCALSTLKSLLYLKAVTHPLTNLVSR